MNRMSSFVKGCSRLAQVAVLLGFITTAGCSAGDNELTLPEGGSAADQAKPEAPKETPNLSSRRDREKAAVQQ